MPLFTLSKTSVDIDYNPEQRKNLKSSILSLIETDTVCYRENP
jgi:chaperone required for assembly of F1-ATPase